MSASFANRSTVVTRSSHVEAANQHTEADGAESALRNPAGPVAHLCPSVDLPVGRQWCGCSREALRKGRLSDPRSSLDWVKLRCASRPTNNTLGGAHHFDVDLADHAGDYEQAPAAARASVPEGWVLLHVQTLA